MAEDVKTMTEIELLRRIAEAAEEWWLDRVPRDPTERALMEALAEWDRWRRGATVEFLPGAGGQ